MDKSTYTTSSKNLKKIDNYIFPCTLVWDDIAVQAINGYCEQAFSWTPAVMHQPTYIAT